MLQSDRLSGATRVNDATGHAADVAAVPTECAVARSSVAPGVELLLVAEPESVDVALEEPKPGDVGANESCAAKIAVRVSIRQAD